MALVAMQRDAVPLGYRIESVWGTDPLAGNLPIPGQVLRCKVNVNQNREPMRGVGSSVDPLRFKWKQHDVSIDLEYEVQNDSPTNSPLSLSLGDAPDAGTGAITNRPTASNKNLRSFTLELGFDWPNADEYWQIVGCMIRRLEVGLRDHALVYRANILGKQTGQPTTAPALSPPSLLSIEPFDSFEDGTVVASIARGVAGNFDVLSDNLRIIIENVLRGRGVVGTGRGLGYLQLAGRSVYVEFTGLKTGSELVTAMFTGPDAATLNSPQSIDFDVTLSKSSGQEFIKAALNNCEHVGQGGIEVADEDEEMAEDWRFQARSYAFDVKTP